MNTLVAEYGGALYSLARDEGIDTALLTEAREISALLKENEDYVRLLSAPNIPARERIDTVQAVFGGRVQTYMLSFLKLMTERGYGREIIACLSEYERLYYESNGIVVARVSCAAEPTAQQLAALQAKLEARTGKKIELRVNVDERLLGGVTVRMEGLTLDGSVRGHLDALRSSLRSAAR